MKNPPVERVKERIMEGITSGMFPEGAKLYSVRFMSGLYGTSKNTICKAISDLAKMGVLEVEERKAPRIKAWHGKKIAVVYSSTTVLLHEPFWWEYFAGIRDSFAKTDRWKLETINTGTVPIPVVEQQLNSGDYAGIIAFGFYFWTFFEEERGAFKSLPIIQILPGYSYGETYEVCLDASSALTPVKDALAEMDSVRTLFFSAYEYGSPEIESSLKYQEIVRILKEAFPGKEPDIKLIVSEKSNAPELLNQLVRIFKNQNYPNFCVVYTDRDARFLFQAMKQANRKCPEDVKLLSYDNLVDSQLTIPTQTSLDLDRRKAGTLAAEMMMDLLDRKPVKKTQCVKAKLVERESFCVKKDSKTLTGKEKKIRNRTT